MMIRATERLMGVVRQVLQGVSLSHRAAVRVTRPPVNSTSDNVMQQAPS